MVPEELRFELRLRYTLLVGERLHKRSREAGKVSVPTTSAFHFVKATLFS
jgi:hypothetical protein